MNRAVYLARVEALSYRKEVGLDTVHIAPMQGVSIAFCAAELEEAEAQRDAEAPAVDLCGKCMHLVIDYLGLPVAVHAEMDRRWADKRVVPDKVKA